jgi:hypothetical protein
MSQVDEKVTTKEEWYDLNKYAEEIQQFVTKKKLDLDVISQMEKDYNYLYSVIFAGGTESKTQRFPHATEMFKVYKSSIIESSLGGYSALLEVTGEDAQGVLKAPEVKKVMTQQFKGMALLEKLSGDTLDDWILKGEAVSYIKLKEKKEEYRVKEKISDATTGEELIQLTVKQGVTTRQLEIERIDPLDFFVDALDYERDPIGCTKIIRSYIDAKTLLTSDAYPLLSKEDKENIICGATKNGAGIYPIYDYGAVRQNPNYNQTDKNRIEVLTFNGDYITSDNKVLSNIKAVVINNVIASVKYNASSVNRIIYAPYKVDRLTHRSISPLSCTRPVNNLINKVCDMFIKNLEDVCVPWVIWQKGSMNAQQIRDARTKKELEYNNIGEKPEFYAPPEATPNGLNLMKLVLDENKNVLGLNTYMAGDSSGAVRTAEESSILFQKANARMRVETDVFSYRYMLNLFDAFYAFNRELALGYEQALDPIYADPELKVNISTNASKADREGELNRLMQMLQLPIAQMIFSNLAPDQVVLAVRYLMAKAQLTDADNLLELIDENGNTQVPTMNADGEPINPPPMQNGMNNNMM